MMPEDSISSVLHLQGSVTGGAAACLLEAVAALLQLQMSWGMYIRQQRGNTMMQRVNINSVLQLQRGAMLMAPQRAGCCSYSTAASNTARSPGGGGGGGEERGRLKRKRTALTGAELHIFLQVPLF